MIRLKIRNWRFNRSWTPVVVITVIFSLFVLLNYFVWFVRIPAVNPPTLNLISRGVWGKTNEADLLFIGAIYIPDAIEVVRGEQSELRSERDAFEAFLNKIKTITPVELSTEPSPQQSGNILTSPRRTQSQEIIRAYKETVRDVPHYKTEYDDTVTESLVEEFGPEIATQLVTGKTYTPLVKNQLTEAVCRCRQEREHVLQTLESEHEALQKAQTTLEKKEAELNCVTACLPSEQSFDELFQNYNCVIDAEETCEEVLEERQQQRVEGHAAVTAPRTDEVDLYPYLYRSLPVTYPVIADATKLIERLQRVQRRLAKQLVARF
jgi:hypothetical protein